MHVRKATNDQPSPLVASWLFYRGLAFAPKQHVIFNSVPLNRPVTVLIYLGCILAFIDEALSAKSDIDAHFNHEQSVLQSTPVQADSHGIKKEIEVSVEASFE
jgi:hypothetical protein